MTTAWLADGAPGGRSEVFALGTPPKPIQADDIPNVGAPARRALAAAGYDRLDQFAGVAEQDLLALHGVGPKAVAILRRALAGRGLSFADAPSRD